MLYFTCIDQGDKFYLSSEGSLVQFSGNKHMQLFLKVLCKSLRYLIDKENSLFSFHCSNIRFWYMLIYCWLWKSSLQYFI